jgi:hypothetical protein
LPNHVLKVGLGQRLDLECQPLVDGSPWEERRKIIVIEKAKRLAVAMPCRPGAGDKSGCLLLVAGEDGETAPAPFGVSESGRNWMLSIDPACRIGRLKARF